MRDVAALLGEIAGGVQWGCVLPRRLTFLSFLFRLRYLMQEPIAGTSTFPKQARMEQSGPRGYADIQGPVEGEVIQNIHTQSALFLQVSNGVHEKGI